MYTRKYIFNNKFLKQERLSCDMTQEELSYKLGVSRNTIVNLEKGTYQPSLNLYYQICQLFNYNYDDFIIGGL